MNDRIRLGISTCLLGEEVRYDGGHKHDRYLTGTLGKYVDFVPVCPEVECGMPVPREAMHLVGDPEHPRLVTIRSRRDMTGQMTSWAAEKLDILAGEDLCGFVFKSKSPSSGMERIKIYDEKGIPRHTGSGIFARMFMERFPLLPVEEEGRLHDPLLRENFISRIFTLKRWRDAMAPGFSRGRVVDFHTRHKLLIRSHSETHYRLMGKLVAAAKEHPPEELHQQYEALLMATLRLKTTVKKNVNVLTHILGYFKKDLSGDEKQELLEIIDRYRNGHVPLIVPVTLMNHFARKYGQAYLLEQVYLNPHPVELGLRNHV